MKVESIEKKVKEMNENYLRSVEDNSDGIKESVIRTLLTAIAILLGVLIWVMCAEKQAEAFEVQAAVVKKNCLTATWMVGAEVVGQIPESQAEEVLPDAIDGTCTGNVHVEGDILETERVGEEPWESIGRYKLTFYCACRGCSGNWGHQTSSGATCVEGITAACAVLPPGTVVKIEGFGERIIQDTGSGVRGNHIDIFMESHEQCLDNGIQYAEVFVKR